MPVCFLFYGNKNGQKNISSVFFEKFFLYLCSVKT